MKIAKTILCTVLLCIVFASAASAKKHKVRQKSLYMVGTAVSLIDSTFFLTDMHLVKDLTVEKKTNFLMDRQLYSQQLKQYLDETYKGGPYVPAVFFSPKRKKMERRYLSLYKRYSKAGELHVVFVDQSQFRFKAEEYIEQTIYQGIAPSADKKKRKKK